MKLQSTGVLINTQHRMTWYEFGIGLNLIELGELCQYLEDNGSFELFENAYEPLGAGLSRKIIPSIRFDDPLKKLNILDDFAITLVLYTAPQMASFKFKYASLFEAV